MTAREEILGHHLFDVFPDNPDDPEATGTRNLNASLQRVLDEGVPDTMAVQKYDIRRPDSAGGGFEERFWSPVNSPVFGADGKVAYIIHRVEDVTEFVRLRQAGSEAQRVTEELRARAEMMEAEILARSQELQEANRRLRELDRAKTDFFNNISHEFRTPLTLQLAPLEDALGDTENPLAPEQRRRIELVRRNVDRLLKLVNSLLDFARLEAGRAAPRFQPTDLSKFTAEVTSNFRSAFDDAGLEMKLDCPPLPRPVDVDRDMWEKIVLNLVSNAFKFTARGHVRVAVRAEGDDVVLEVSDTGIGIPAEELPRLFERFHRVRSDWARNDEGTGIGLAFVRELAAIHGGSVTAASEPGRGSTFTVTIPMLARAPVGASEAPAPPASGAPERAASVVPREPARRRAGVSAPQAGSYILIADDNVDMRDYIADILEPNWPVVTVADGAAALDAARASLPEMVVTDVMMPVMDGFELLRQLRGDPSTAQVPVIMLSARAADTDTVEGLEAGADDYLAKPFSSRELIARVRVHITLARMRKELAVRNQALTEKSAQLEAANASIRDFVAVTSHDLKGPLAAILGYSQLLIEHRDELPPEQVTDILRVIERNTLLLSRMADNLLTCSRLDGGSLDIRPRDLDLKALALQVLEDFPAQRDSIRLEVPDGVTARADSDHVRRILENLVSNALKYGGPPVELKAVQDDTHVQVLVADHGEGVPVEFLPRLFDRFARADNDATRREHGTGLGLAIARGMARANGGEVSYDCSDGSCFILELPAARTSPSVQTVNT